MFFAHRVIDSAQMELYNKLKLEQFDTLRVDLDISLFLTDRAAFFVHKDILMEVSNIKDGVLESDHYRLNPYYLSLRAYMDKEAKNPHSFEQYGEVGPNDIVVGVYAYKKVLGSSYTGSEERCQLMPWCTRYLYKAEDDTCHYVEPVMPADAEPGSLDYIWI